jgi:hypothetical protein
MPPRGHKLSDAARARIREGTARGRRSQLARKRLVSLIAPRDLERLVASGTITPALRPLVDIAATEALELSESLGGPENLSAQQRLVIQDLASVGIVLRATLAAFLQKPGGDSDLASRVGTLAGQRRSSVALLGLESVARDVPSLSDYSASRAAEGRAGATNGAAGESEVTDA